MTPLATFQKQPASPLMKRIVVTGLGLVTPLACGVEETWSRLLAGKSGAGQITRFDASDINCHIACELPREGEGAFIADDWMAPKDQRKVDDFILYGMAAGQQAVEDSGWAPDDEEALCRTGVMM